MSSALRVPILCDCESRKYCRTDQCGSAYVGSLAVSVRDCKTGTDCGYRFTNYCVCTL